jgi:SPP1 gp7 family putative phage head morphogenesis protein
MPRRVPRRDTKTLLKTWAKTRNAEKQFARKLRSLARRCGEFARHMYDPGDPHASSSRLRQLLDRYAETIRPWAHESAKRMVLDVTRRDESLWRMRSKEIGRNLHEEIRSAPIDLLSQRRISEVSDLITSLPREAGKRVAELSVKMVEEGRRFDELSDMIFETGQVTKSRANLIARTEVARTSSDLVQARSKAVGSTHYIWRSVGDDDVRPRHRKLNGNVFSWDAPPVAGEQGEKAHPGAIYNCRCFPEPIISDE